MRSRTYFMVSIVGLAMLAFMATVAIQRWASAGGPPAPAKLAVNAGTGTIDTGDPCRR